MKIGFIGLGRMGSAMAANLIEAGFDVTVYNRSSQKAEPLVQMGAHQALRVAEASQGEVVITMLANDNAVSAAVLGKCGIVESLPAGAIHVSMSTVSVALAHELAQAHARAGQQFVSAPVFGRPEAAAFLAPLGYKDIGLTLAAAENLRVPMPLAGLLRDRFLRLLAHGGEGMDWSAIGGLASDDAQSRVTGH